MNSLACSCAFVFEFKILLLVCLDAVAGLLDAQQEPATLKFRKLIYREETPATKAFSSVSHHSPPLCQRVPFLRIKVLCGDKIPDSGLCIVPVLNTVLSSWVEFVAILGGRRPAMRVGKDQ